MTTQELNIKVAEAMGIASEGHWRCLSCNKEVQPNFVTYGETHDGCGHPVEWLEAPSFATSLDACAEFERTLDLKTGGQYWAALDEILGYPGDLYKIVCATPTQRCRAFLAVKGVK